MTALGSPAGRDLAGIALQSPYPKGGLRQLLRERYLIRLLVRREIAQLYAASLVGLLWSYVQPAMRFGVYFFIFGTVLKVERAIPNFAVHLITGMVFVHFFSEAWAKGTRSVRHNRALVLKMRMPRQVFPVASILVAAVHTFPQVLLLAALCVATGWKFSLANLVAGLLGGAILMTFSGAMAILFSALNVLRSDFQNIVATVAQFLHFLVPMMYGFPLIARIEVQRPWLYELYLANPLAEAVLLLQKGFWYGTTGSAGRYANHFPPDLLVRGVVMLGCCLVLLILAERVFRHLESQFPERL